MVIPSYIVLMALVVALDTVTGTDDFMNCMIQEICEEPGGEDEAMKCLQMLAENDQSYCLKFFGTYFSMEATFEKLIEKGCTEPEESKEAFNKYYDERKNKESKDKESAEEFSADDDKKLADTRVCVSQMINRCMLKKEMGML